MLPGSTASSADFDGTRFRRSQSGMCPPPLQDHPPHRTDFCGKFSTRPPHSDLHTSAHSTETSQTNVYPSTEVRPPPTSMHQYQAPPPQSKKENKSAKVHNHGFNCIADPTKYSDTDSITRVIQSGSELFLIVYVALCNYYLHVASSATEEDYLVVLVQQEFTTCRSQSWRVIFTVCMRNPCCVKVILHST